MTLQEVRLAVEPIVLSFLGTYSNGDPAISSGEPNSSLTVTGLECVIDRVPQINSTPTFDSAHITKEWVVRLLDHGGGQPIDEALNALLTRFPFAPVDPLVSSPAWGIAPQVAIRIPDRMRAGLPRR